MDSQIDNWIRRIDQTSKDFETSFSGLVDDQLNTKPSSKEWSIAQCIDHLIQTNEKYFSILHPVARGEHQNPFWGKVPGVAGFIGKMILGAVEEDGKKKSKTFPPFEPSKSALPETILKDFLDQQAKLKQLYRSLESIDLKTVIITSPVSSMVVYSAEDACEIVVSHERRHLNQALKVKERIS